jgi:hypothetical protein
MQRYNGQRSLRLDQQHRSLSSQITDNRVSPLFPSCLSWLGGAKTKLACRFSMYIFSGLGQPLPTDARRPG